VNVRGSQHIYGTRKESKVTDRNALGIRAPLGTDTGYYEAGVFHTSRYSGVGIGQYRYKESRSFALSLVIHTTEVTWCFELME
jgi:hypothetical protein